MPAATSTIAPELAVVGAGAWGTVLAQLLCQSPAAPPRVTLWARRAAHAAEITQTRENRRYVPGLQLSPRLQLTAELATLAGADAVFMAVPTQGLREVLAQMPPVRALISCAKGLELGSFKRLSEVMTEYQPAAMVAALSGPNLAGEIARGLPASATVASQDEVLTRRVQGWLNQRAFRVYTGADLAGLELGGALKNVIAVAAGLSDGLGLGDNARATLVTRGLAEMVRLGVRLGGEAQTFYGLSGLGDLMATCSSEGSRNHQAGVRLARGETWEMLRAAKLTAEGVPTVAAVVAYAQAQELELPIAQAVYDVIFAGKAPARVIGELMARGTKAEW